MLYGTKCWAIKKHVHKMSITDMRLLNWKVEMNIFSEMGRAVPIKDKLRENKYNIFIECVVTKYVTRGKTCFILWLLVVHINSNKMNGSE